MTFRKLKRNHQVMKNLGRVDDAFHRCCLLPQFSHFPSRCASAILLSVFGSPGSTASTYSVITFYILFASLNFLRLYTGVFLLFLWLDPILRQEDGVNQGDERRGSIGYNPSLTFRSNHRGNRNRRIRRFVQHFDSYWDSRSTEQKSKGGARHVGD